MDGSSVGVGFLGAGGIAQRALGPATHAAEGVHLEAVAARDAGRAAALGPSGHAYDDYRALLADPAVELVYVALNNDAHRPWTLAALEAGKHVLCEKPLGLDAAEVAELRAAAAAADRLLVEAFWYRWHPRTRRLEQLLGQGALGPVRHVSADFTFQGPREGDLATHYRLDPARGGGGLYDVGCYALSAAHLALGPVLTPGSVEADIGPTGVDLALRADMSTPDGATAEIRCGIAAPDRQELVVRGEAATVELAPPTFFSWHSPSTLTITTPDRGLRVEEFAPVDPYLLMIRAVGRRIRGDEDAFVLGLDHSAAVAGSIDAIRDVLAKAAVDHP